MWLFAFSLLVFFVFIIIHVLGLNYDQQVVPEEKRINKLAVLLTKESLDGELVDCVNTKTQPTLDHPLLVGQKIQKIKKDHLKKMPEIWPRNERSLRGTVPIRRSTIASDVMRVNSRSTFKHKQDYSFYRKTPSDGKFKRVMAHYRPTTTNKINGVQARINLWQPSVTENAYSSSQIWIVSKVNRIFNLIEVGWHVFPHHYGDNNTRLFIHWTISKGHESSGCYNLDCEGFIQKKGVEEIGKSYEPVSSYGDPPHFIIIQVMKHPSSGNWTLLVDNKRVGIWPREMFTHLADGATGVSWGGETWIRNTDKEEDDHDGDGEEEGEDTKAEMGSGRFAQEGYGKASYFDKLAVAFGESHFHSVEPDDLSMMYTSPCYNITAAYDINGVADDNGFFYGGPGVGPSCTHK